MIALACNETFLLFTVSAKNTVVRCFAMTSSWRLQWRLTLLCNVSIWAYWRQGSTIVLKANPVLNCYTHWWMDGYENVTIAQSRWMYLTWCQALECILIQFLRNEYASDHVMIQLDNLSQEGFLQGVLLSNVTEGFKRCSL